MSRTVAVGLSGGVDSSTAAVLLLEQGYEVVGVTMRHLPGDSTNSCCSLEAIVDARKVAKKLGIAHYLVDVEAPFYERVMAPFEAAYLMGRTPNPCALCNRHIKFGAMWDWAHSRGAEFLATGHYARILPGGDGYRLLRGHDRQKDQSYLMYTLGQNDLAHLLFPLGHLTKAESRAIAADHGLVTAAKADSQELCFVPRNDYAAYLREHRPEAEKPGDVVDTGGHVLGRHRGIAFYTVGQRRGLGISAPAPQYVVRLDPERNQVVVGPHEAVEVREVWVDDVNYIAGREPGRDVGGAVKIRYNMEPQPARWMALGQGARVRFEDAQWAASPGQVAVLYQGEVLLGGGRIHPPTN
ncbi:MAG: tRNA 2-thiouridine(34) synthase MnmA [Thermaerobacter sp.]|nr:tRNA 2-thiouridine(34) synthase MnmA [Thermaerobacter sp.]